MIFFLYLPFSSFSYFHLSSHCSLFCVFSPPKLTFFNPALFSQFDIILFISIIMYVFWDLSCWLSISSQIRVPPKGKETLNTKEL